MQFSHPIPHRSTYTRAHTPGIRGYAAYLAVWGVLFAFLSGTFAFFDILPEPAAHANEPGAAAPPARSGERAAAAASTLTTQEKPESDTTAQTATPDTPAAAAAAERNNTLRIKTEGTPARAVRTGPLPASAPRRIIIPRIKVDAPVISPSSTAIPVLEEALMRGVVHYPTSGFMDDVSNVFLFGHSSELPYVRNKNYKVFNRLKELLEGDIIKIQTRDTNYVYRVRRVSLVLAPETPVVFSTETRMLTLATCNVLGEEDERYLVEAYFVGAFPIID